jgi:hypothetical protein
MPEITLNEGIRPLAKSIIAKFQELNHVQLDEILFVNSDAEGGSVKYVEVKKIPPIVAQTFEKKFNRWYQYIVVVYQTNCAEFSREQRVLSIYHALRHIGEDGLVKHDIEEFAQVALTIGADWARTKRKIPDILAENFDWSKIEPAQQRLFQEGEGPKADPNAGLDSFTRDQISKGMLNPDQVDHLRELARQSRDAEQTVSTAAAAGAGKE